MTWKVTRISIKGVKGTLDKSGDFDLPNGKSIAIFARNGCGKSGYADAIEYFFSSDGEVEHLGKGGADSERGGKHAIRHVLAEEKGIPSVISVTISRQQPSKETVTATRAVNVGRADPLPVALDAIIRAAPAHRILRQHDLRRFVVDMNPREKYSELSRWLGLERLEQILAHLTTTQNELAKTNPDREFTERLQDIPRHTENSIQKYDPKVTLEWCSSQVKRHLGEATPITSVVDLEPVIAKLTQHRDQLVLLSGRVTDQFKSKVALEKVIAESTSDASPITKLENAVKSAVASEKHLEEVRSKVSDNVFQEVWEAAYKLLSSRKLDQCPVCSTPWGETGAGTQDKAQSHLSANLESLGNLVKAQSRFKESESLLAKSTAAFVQFMREVEAYCKVLSCDEASPKVSALCVTSETLASAGELSPTAKIKECEDTVRQCREIIGSSLYNDLNKVVIDATPATSQVDESINHIRALKDTLTRLAELQREREEYKKVSAGFLLVAEAIQSEASQLLTGVVKVLLKDLQQMYRKIHPAMDVPNIYLKPDTETKTLVLRIDFHSEGRTVPPAGYLSESYINTLGLALFLSCARHLNSEFPFIFLDDIVSSYDAEHRARIADLIAEDLGDFQIFLTTHDDLFYSILKSRLEDRDWKFERISNWSLDEGPKRETDLLRPAQVSALINDTDPNAGNAVRQYMEEWLDKMCARYYVYTLHKRFSQEYNRTLFDYWQPFIKRCSDISGDFFNKHVAKAACFKRLSVQPLINYYSHWQASPYQWPSIGDVKYVWEEFQAFEKIFHCYSCSKLLRYDHDSNSLFCSCGKDIFPP